jgi:hypothetical protein
MAKKSKKTVAARPARGSKQLSVAEAIKLHADAITHLSNALTGNQGAPAASGTGAAVRLAPLSRTQILAELAKIWGAASVKETDDINKYFDGGPGAVVAFWEPLDDWPPFRDRHLHLGPNDLRFVTTVGELVSVIAWGLRSAK